MSLVVFVNEICAVVWGSLSDYLASFSLQEFSSESSAESLGGDLNYSWLSSPQNESSSARA